VALVSFKEVNFSATILELTGFGNSASLTKGFGDSTTFWIFCFKPGGFRSTGLSSTGLATGLGYSGALSISTVLATGLGAMSFTDNSYLAKGLVSGLATGLDSLGLISGFWTIVIFFWTTVAIYFSAIFKAIKEVFFWVTFEFLFSIMIYGVLLTIFGIAETIYSGVFFASTLG
jgi:hypothetical protein